jgi:hypothetical protein
MVSPRGFKPDLETALDNAFQVVPEEPPPPSALEDIALKEFVAVVAALRGKGIEVNEFEGKPELPGGVFPNNWLSTHEDGTLVLYPMSTFGRRLERRPEIVNWLEVRYPQVVDLSSREDRGEFLEGTGSLVLDRENRIAFVARSGRTNETLVNNWCADFEYEAVLFDTTGPRGLPVYHTNVLMTLGAGYAVVCTECIDNPLPVISALLASGRELIEITKTQMASFCGNMLELEGETRFLAMSSTARQAFTSRQLKAIEALVETVSLGIPTIERYGGGGVRCMLAELF